MIDQYTRAAIIGWRRSGATIEQIMALLDFKFRYWEVEEVILSICPAVMLAEYEEDLKAIIIE